MFKRADELREGDRVEVYDWVGVSTVTAVTGPYKPHLKWKSERVCVRVQLDHLNWELWDVDFEIEVL